MKAWKCKECDGMLKAGMAIKKTSEGNYHTHCWWRKQDRKNEQEKKDIERRKK